MDLPRPWIFVLVGGSSELFTLGARIAAKLAREASAMARKHGGSLLVTTSSHTSHPAIAGLRASIDVPQLLFQWRPDPRENPYLGFLALADEIIVICDSTSMPAEACATRKPVYIFDRERTDPRPTCCRRQGPSDGLPPAPGGA